MQDEEWSGIPAIAARRLGNFRSFHPSWVIVTRVQDFGCTVRGGISIHSLTLNLIGLCCPKEKLPGGQSRLPHVQLAALQDEGQKILIR